MNHTEKTLEFDKIKEQWLTYAMTEAARDQIRSMTPCLQESKLRLWLKETTEARKMIEKAGNPPLVSFLEIPQIIEIAEKEGCLTAEQLEKVGDALVAVKRLIDYLSQCKVYDFSLAYYEENLSACDNLRETIRIQIRNGAVDDYATKLLQSIRSKLSFEETKVREKAEQIMRTHKSYMSDSFATTRNGHMCVPVKKEYRHQVPGILIDKSSSGSTLFIEPSAVGKHYESIQALKLDEENEEIRIRYELTGIFLNELPAFLQNMHTIEKLDFAFSKGKLSLAYDGTEPQINTERRIDLKDARHPLMDKTVCVPLQFQIGNGIRGVIITGPNTGGKTVSIKTVALNSYMAQCGLHVACKEADICMNANYLCDIGDGQNLSENLSTFSAHLKNILNILEQLTSESLVILDELGSGTDPTEGMGIAIAVLEQLKNSNALFLVTTHYPEVKHYAQKETAIINARMDFDKENLKPLYQLIIGEAGESCAFSIAKKLGMPDEMLRIAESAAYGTDTEYSLKATALNHKALPKIQKQKVTNTKKQQALTQKYHIGDSVMIYPDKKIGIVCEPINEKGVLRIQMPDKKIWINHKRVKLHVAAKELYPEDYDFSILFDSVENRKIHHQMERKYVEDTINIIEES
ncbi:MAG: DNA mismatch repair protein MutS [Lachnospiraceae bacterium]|nr:DNA mismatch repair protein MutS [Lachnospiraceae bacterium]